MKILHVIDMISQYKAGGSAKVPYQLGEAQAKLGHEVTIFTSDYQAESQTAPKGVTLRKFHCVLNLLGGVRITPSMLTADFTGFDIIHLHNYRTFVNIIASSNKIPHVLQAHGSCSPVNGLTEPIHNAVWRNMIFNRSAAYIADADMEIKQYLTEGADRSQVSLVPVGIDYNEFRKLPARVTSAKRRVLFLGRFHPIKGADLLIKAFSLLERDNVTLIMAGVDYGTEELDKELVKELGIEDKVEFIGPRYDYDKVIEYTKADVYVMPSRYEMFGLTFLEALACGTPVIMTDRCGAAPLLPRECGYVVPFDEKILADAIDYSLYRREAESYRQYRINWAKQYDWKNLAPQIMQVYEGVLK